MKDIILWQSATSRERAKRHLTGLSAIHRSTTPPSELMRDPPRKSRWKLFLKLIVTFQMVILAFWAYLVVWAIVTEVRFHSQIVEEIANADVRLRSDAAQSTDPQKKAKIESVIRNDVEFMKKWRILNDEILAFILAGFCISPVGNLGITWFYHARPEIILLRRGLPVRAIIVGKKRRLLGTRLEARFTTDRGEAICKRQFVRPAEALLFEIGSPVWMLYSPSRPSLAKIYGLKSALVELVP